MTSKEADLLMREDTSDKVKYDQYVIFATQRVVSVVRLYRMDFASTLIPVSLPQFITERCHVMIQITERIFYCRYRRTECHFGHIIRLFITSNTNVTRNPAKKNCFASVHQCCIVLEELHNVSRFSLQVLNSKETRQRV